MSMIAMFRRNLLGSFIAYIILLGTPCSLRATDIHDKSTNAASLQDNGESYSHECQQLRILTWNVWLMPPWTFQSPRNGRRAKAIARQILSKDFDIVCLEKVFDDDARRVLSQMLGQKYKYRYGPANAGLSIIPLKLVNSGLWIASRCPLYNQQELEFTNCSGIECFSRKGAMSLMGNFCGHRFRLVVTHLQGDEGRVRSERNACVRDAQLRQIATTLLNVQDIAKRVPTLFCGDFCTSERDDQCKRKFSHHYLSMLATLHAENDDENHVTLIDDRQCNELAIDNTGRASEEDYILVRPNHLSITVKRSTAVFRECGWDGNPLHCDLSYRYGLSARIKFD